MEKLTRSYLYSLEQYASIRNDFRARVMEHKKPRRISLGKHLELYFEDHLTMQYQVQEMLRIERIFEANGIDEELDAYNPLIPDGSNWKATMMLEYDDVEERRIALGSLVGIEERIWVQVEGFNKVFAIADEDLERTHQHKTSSVHFLRFELGEEAAARAKQGASISMGVNHPEYTSVSEMLNDVQANSLRSDLL